MQRLALALLLALPKLATAQTPPDVADLVNARGAGGETQLEARGYRQVMTNSVRDTVWSFWWSERQRQCISVATNDGRYSSINRVPESNCTSSASGYRASEVASGDSFALVCIGAGSGPAAQSTSGYRYNSKTRKFESEFGTTLGREGFASDVEIEVGSGTGRIRPTGKLISPIHSGGVDGWWPIEGLMVTPDRVSGRYRMNGMNQPRIDYDRRSRVLHIRAATDFTGRCEER